MHAISVVSKIYLLNYNFQPEHSGDERSSFKLRYKNYHKLIPKKWKIQPKIYAIRNLTYFSLFIFIYVRLLTKKSYELVYKK